MMGITFEVFGIFRAEEDANRALRSGGYLHPDVHSADITDAELLRIWKE